MVLTISSNISAIAALRHTRSNDADLSRSVERLSSGSRINSARDDASGLAISRGLQRDLATIRAAQSNIAQASSMLQIADSGFESIQGKINRMSELSAMSQSGNLTTQERNAIDVEFQLLKDGITQDTLSTTFNGVNLMGQRPEFVVDNIGADVQTDDGFVSYRFDNNNPRIQDGDTYEITYNATTEIMQLRNQRTNFRESVSLSSVVPIPGGNLEEVKFEDLGVRIRLSSEFDDTTDIDPVTNSANFTARVPTPTAPSFVPTDIPNLVQNLSAEDSPLTFGGGGVQSVGDLEPNAGGNNATQGNAGRQPSLSAGSVFGRDALDFSGNVNNRLDISNNGAINTSPQNERAIAMSFRTGADVTSLQVLYEEGGPVNSIAAYIENGTFYFSTLRSSGGQTAFVSTPITPNTEYTASFDFDAGSNNVRGYLNGAEFGNVAGIGGSLPSHPGNIGLGDVAGNVRIHDGRTINSSNGFEGQIADFLLYNNSLTATEHGQLDTFLQGSVPTTSGFSDEQLQFKIDNVEGKLLTYDKAKTDLMLTDISGLNIRNVAAATTAQNTLREASNFINTERANIGALISKLEFAATQTDVFAENTTNANSVIADTDIAAESTTAVNRLTQSQVNITVLDFANQSNDQLLDLLEPPAPPQNA